MTVERDTTAVRRGGSKVMNGMMALFLEIVVV